MGKVCSKCHVEKPETDFSKCGEAKDGLRSCCRACVANYSKPYYAAKKKIIAEKNRRWYEENKISFSKYRRQWDKDNAEHVKAYREAYKESHVAEIVARRKKWYENNPDYNKLWRANNQEYLRNHMGDAVIKNQKRRARNSALPHTLTREQWEKIKQRFGGTCAYCGKNKPLTQEHFIPLIKGGEFTHNNIICACQNCNATKGAKDFFDWYPKQSFYSIIRERRILKF